MAKVINGLASANFLVLGSNSGHERSVFLYELCSFEEFKGRLVEYG